MLRRLIVPVALATLVAVPADAGAQGAVAFTSARCDQGGVPFSGSGATGICTPGIFVVGDDGSNLRRLTTGGVPGESHRSGDFGPTWSHDGEHIAFGRQTNEGHGLNRIFVMRANGSETRRLLASSQFDDERDPSWSPKADLIVFKARRPNDSVPPPLWVAASDGSGLRRISPNGWDAQSPEFMPDGSGIAFVAARPIPGQFAGTSYDVWLTKPNGGTPVRLTAGDIPIATNAISFSPGGKYLAVTLYDGSLYTVRTDGGDLTRLTRNHGIEAVWSASGDALFYRSGTGSTNAVIKRLGFPPVAPPKSISAPGVADSSPDWSLPGLVTSAAPVADKVPPVVLLGETLADPPSEVSEEEQSGSSRKRLAAAQIPGPALSKIPFLVMDRSGIRTIEAAAGLRVKGGCRFLQSSRKLARRRSCAHPTYVTVRDGEAWKKLAGNLPKGKYEVRFRTVDREGNAVRRPKPRIVRVR